MTKRPRRTAIAFIRSIGNRSIHDASMPTPFFRLPRFDLKTLFICVAGFCVLFGWMRLADSLTTTYVVVGSLFATVGLGSAAFFGGRRPLVASFLSGGIWGLGCVVVTFVTYEPNVNPVAMAPTRGEFVLPLLFMAVPGGAMLGVVTGIFIDIFFWLCGGPSRWPDDDPTETTTAVELQMEVAEEASVALPVELHPLDRD